ncbi:MAG: dephospho-CoA kinase [Dehalococcoidia bacterium]|nr:MAG: dephospho-CoA kinase [Dehalococcoidia bacterium]
MKIIGLTGGISSGKSTVSRFLAGLGAVILDADKVGHKAFKPDTELWQEVVAAFGRQILKPSGEIDREKLGGMVFGNPKLLAQLNQIMHPRMYDMMQAQLEEYRQQGVGVVVLEAALLLEANWTSLVDEVWVTAAAESTVLKRLKEKSGLSEPQSWARIRSQMSNEERVKRADVVIDTDCSLDELKARVKELWEKG